MRVCLPSRSASSVILLAMRLAVIGVVAVLLLGPSRQKPRPDQTQQPRLTILLDTSESMRTLDCGSNSRIAHVAKNLLDADLLRKLRGKYRIDLRGFDERVHPVALEELYARPLDIATGRGTHVTESVVGVVSQLDGKHGDAMLVVSDGHDTEEASIQPAAAAAKAKGIPVYTTVVGGSISTPEAALLAVPMQDNLLPGEAGAILVKVYQSGLDQSSTTLRFKQGDRVSQFPIDFRGRRMVEMQVPVKEDNPGQYKYELAIDAVAGESEMANNSQTVFCEVMKRRIRVLVIEGQPFWDTKFLAASLRKDERIELTQITQVGEQKRETIVSRVEKGTPRIPTNGEEWANYEVVILGRGMERVLDRKAAELLASYIVDGGGQLIFVRGQAYDRNSDPGRQLAEALAVLEPVVWGNTELHELSLELSPSGAPALGSRRSSWGSISSRRSPACRVSRSCNPSIARNPARSYWRGPLPPPRPISPR